MFSKRQRRQRAVVAGLATLAVLFGAFALNRIGALANPNAATAPQVRVTAAAVAGFH